MRVPDLQRSPSFMQGLGLFLGGVVIGCAVMTAISTRTVQELQYDIQDLSASNRVLADQVAAFEKGKNRRNVIDRTAVRWDAEQKDLGKATLGELESRIAADLLKIVGKQVQPDMYDIYRGLIDGKVYYNVNGTDYRIHITVLSVIGSEYVVYVRAESFVPDRSN
ncbi:hypothetical protein [Paenibacillus sp.]|uniref:hypothetical protein n=1 Tax=Paenibacillus sp. TaxID=58172 RepID=UPI0028118241|nr:hypothetical protein [Paenibacillus sp.]